MIFFRYGQGIDGRRWVGVNMVVGLEILVGLKLVEGTMRSSQVVSVHDRGSGHVS